MGIKGTPMTLSYLRPFSQGLSGEIQEGMVRIYDGNGFPRIEVYDEDGEGLDELVQEIVEVLNAGPDKAGS